jgi:hypothetical protein
MHMAVGDVNLAFVPTQHPTAVLVTVVTARDSTSMRRMTLFAVSLTSANVPDGERVTPCGVAANFAEVPLPSAWPAVVPTSVEVIGVNCAASAEGMLRRSRATLNMENRCLA